MQRKQNSSDARFGTFSVGEKSPLETALMQAALPNSPSARDRAYGLLPRGLQPYYNQAAHAPSTSVPNESSPGSGSRAATYDDDKSPLAWLPWNAIEAMNRVQMYGGKKYKDYNNYRKGMEVSRNLSCALRHIKAYLSGEDFDTESGVNHLAHAMCRLAFVLENIADGTAIDDRYKKP